jgi:Undecaprenyl-phosphate galactose phosphotransferase WbaP
MTDTLALFASAFTALLVRHSAGGHFSPADYLPFLAAFPVFLLMYGLAGLYPGIAMNPVDELRRITYATTAAYLIVIGATFLGKAGADYSRLIFIGAWALSLFVVTLARTTTRKVLGPKPWWGVPVVVFGAGSSGSRFVDVLRRTPSLGFRPVAVLDDDPAKHRGVGPNGEPPVLGSLSLATRLATEHGIRYAAVAMPSVPTRQLAGILHRHAHQFPHFLLVPDFFGIASVWVTAKDVGGIFGLEVQQNLIRRIPQTIKRLFDLALVTVGGLFVLPLFALIAVAVKLTSRGHVFYSQNRIGQNGVEFAAWKFRSMVLNADAVLKAHLDGHPDQAAEWANKHKLAKDPRITYIGKLLRKTSLDELPQIWNVLIGQMSLVGPRPIVAAELEKYAGAIELYLKVRPGITGLWQVSGRSNTTYEERVSLDEYYVRNWSVWLDIHVLARTVKTVLKADGAC